MKNNINKELILQVAILLVCGVILFVKYSKLNVQAQVTCNIPLTSEVTSPFAVPSDYAWLPGQTRISDCRIF